MNHPSVNVEDVVILWTPGRYWFWNSQSRVIKYENVGSDLIYNVLQLNRRHNNKHAATKAVAKLLIKYPEYLQPKIIESVTRLRETMN